MLRPLRDLLGPDRDAPAVAVAGLTETFRIYHSRPSGLKEWLARASRPSYTDFDALRDVSFTVERGEAVGIVGHNGSGKSTLLKVLARILLPDAGSVAVQGRVAALLELGAGFHGDLSGRENVFLNGAILGLSRAELVERFDEIVSFAGVGPFLDTPVRNYSSGMYVRLAFAIAVAVEPDVLLVDEVLAVGDAEFQGRSRARMRRFRDDGATLLVVSHDLEEIAALCDRVLVLDRGRILFDGPVTEGVGLYEQLIAAPAATDDAAAADTPRHRAVRVVEAVLTDREGRTAHAVAPGTPLLLRIRVEAEQDVDACSVGTRLERGEETMFETHTAWHGVGIGPLRPGEQAVVDVRLEANLLAGHHRIHTSVTDADARFTWAHAAQTVDLEITPVRGAVGVVDLAPSVAVSQGPALPLRRARPGRDHTA